MFEPWIIVWQLMQGGRSGEPAFIPCTVAAETGLWHWLHSWLMLATFSIRGFCDPCGVWQPVQPSPFTAACSNTQGPRVSAWHLVQIMFWSAVDLVLFALNVPCGSWQSLHFTRPSFTLWWNGMLNAGFTSAWHW